MCWPVAVGDHDAHRWTVVDDGSWSIDYDDPWDGQEEYHIDFGFGGSVEPLDPDGNRTWASWGGAQGGGGSGSPGFTVETPGQVWGNGEFRPIGATVNLAVHDVSTGLVYTDSTEITSWGSEPWDVGFNVDLNGLFGIEPTDVVTITSDFDVVDGVLDVDRSLVVADMGEINVDPLMGVVSGYAPPEAWVNVNGGNQSEGAWREVQADGDRFFTADLAFAAEPGKEGDGTIALPFSKGTGGSAQIFDEDGDSTHRGWCIGCDEGGVYLQVYSTSTLPGTYDIVTASMSETAVMTITREGDLNSPYTFPNFRRWWRRGIRRRRHLQYSAR